MEGLFYDIQHPAFDKNLYCDEKNKLHRCCNYILLSCMLLCKCHVPHVPLYVSERYQEQSVKKI